MYDVVIIGAGPAGLSAALYLARVDLRVLLVDAEAPRHGVAGAIHSLLTHDGRAPLAFRELAHADLARYSEQVVRREAPVVGVDGERGRFRVRTADGGFFDGARVLLAMGVVDHLPPIPGIAEAWATSVHHCPWCWGFEGRGLRMGLLVDRVEGATPVLPLGRLAGELHGFWHGDGPVPDVLTEVCARRGVVLHPRRVQALELDGKQLRAVRLDDGTALPLDTLYLHPQQEQVPLVEVLRVALDEHGSVQVDDRSQTTVRGIYAAGDLVTKTRQQVVHALSMGAEAGICLAFDLSGPRDLNLLTGEPRTAPASPDDESGAG